MLNLDTHVLIYALTDELTARERRLLAHDSWSVSDIVFWELAKLTQLGRIRLELDDPQLTRALARVHVWHISLEICRAIPGLDFRSDPADELIAATSLVHGVPLVTRDRKLRRSKRVPLAR